MEIDEIRWAINSNSLSDSRQLGDILIELLQHIERLETLIKPMNVETTEYEVTLCLHHTNYAVSSSALPIKLLVKANRIPHGLDIECSRCLWCVIPNREKEANGDIRPRT